MSVSIKTTVDHGALTSLATMPAGVKRALRMAGATALRDANSEKNKRIKERKRIGPSYINKATTLKRPKGAGAASMEWAIEVSGEPVPLVAYPHRQTKKGVIVEVNRGKRTLLAGSFKATMKSGHKGIFKRKGTARLPIKEFFGSRPLDALLHQGEAEAVLERGRESFAATFARVLPLELAK